MGITQEEKVSMVSVFLVMTTSWYLLSLDFPAAQLSSTVAVALHTDRRWATQASVQGVARTCISLYFMTFTIQLIVGVPRIMGTCAMKFKKSGTTRAIWSSL